MTLKFLMQLQLLLKYNTNLQNSNISTI